MVLNSNDLWDLADEQWFCEGQASPTLKIRESNAGGVKN